MELPGRRGKTGARKHMSLVMEGARSNGGAAGSGSASTTSSVSVPGNVDDFFGFGLMEDMGVGAMENGHVTGQYSSGNGEEDEKKKRKLQRNREVARQCRKRKKEREQEKEEELKALRERVRVLELEIKKIKNEKGRATSGRGNRSKEDEEKRVETLNKMARLLHTRNSENQLKSLLKLYSETYADFGAERRHLINVHLKQLEQLLLPTQISKMLFWILQQEDDFFSDPRPEGMWNMLCKDLKLDARQKRSFMDLRDTLGVHGQNMKKCLKSLKALEAEIATSMERRGEDLKSIDKIFSTQQKLRFLLWVEKNQAAIHLLNNSWKLNNL